MTQRIVNTIGRNELAEQMADRYEKGLAKTDNRNFIDRAQFGPPVLKKSNQFKVMSGHLDLRPKVNTQVSRAEIEQLYGRQQNFKLETPAQRHKRIAIEQEKRLRQFERTPPRPPEHLGFGYRSPEQISAQKEYLDKLRKK